MAVAASSGPKLGYHHGSLREALVDAGVSLARTGGPSAVLLRAASRQAGVSHNAAYRHFANHEDLLAAVAQRCMAELGALMIARTALVKTRRAPNRARDRLEAIGRAYIDFARSEPGWFRTAFTSARPSPDAPDADPQDELAEGNRHGPYELLSARLDEMVDVGLISPARRPGAEFAAWSAVHGLASLLVDGPLRDLAEADVETAIRTVLDAVDRGLEG